MAVPDTAADLNAALVAELQRRGGLRDPRVAEVFTRTPRHAFLPGAPLEAVYAADTAVPLSFDDDSGEVAAESIMPMIVAQMLDQLDVQPGQNVLEIGTGTGYTAALIAGLVGEAGSVTTIEINRSAAEHARDTFQRLGLGSIRVIEGDGAMGYAPRAAYDRIVSTVGVWDVPPLWVRQLKPTGRLVIPIWLDGLQVLAAFHPQERGLYAERVTPGHFLYMQGMAAGPVVRKRVGSTSLTLISEDVDNIDTASLQVLMLNDPERMYLTKALDQFGYWYGFLPYAMVNEPQRYLFALYDVVGRDTAYGLTGDGFALIGRGSACFVPYYGLNDAHGYGSAEAYLAVEKLLDRWQKAGRPGLDQLRLRLFPHAFDKPTRVPGKIYTRQHHYLHVWQERPDAPEAASPQAEVPPDGVPDGVDIDP